MSISSLQTPVLVVAFALTMSCDKIRKMGGSSDVKLETDNQKASYAIGTQIGKGMKSQGLTIDPAIIGAGIADVMEGKQLKLSDEEMQKAVQTMRESMQKRMSEEAGVNMKKGKDFLDENKKKSGVKTTASGLQYEVLTEGKGATPKDSDTVKVHYKGTLVDGTEFDSSYKRNTPAEFPVKGVIRGWTEALLMMKAGSKWKLVIPSELAYGDQNRPNIPANSVLVFEVELLEVKK